MPVNFARGASSTTLEGSIRGDQYIDYRIAVRAGQMLRVNMTTVRGSPYFNVMEPGSRDVAIFIGSANGAAPRHGPKLIDVARRAGVSTGTVSAAYTRPTSLPEATRAKVELAATELGYVPGGGTGEPAPHWRRNGFATAAAAMSRA